jgi:hypothetical protein
MNTYTVALGIDTTEMEMPAENSIDGTSYPRIALLTTGRKLKVFSYINASMFSSYSVDNFLTHPVPIPSPEKLSLPTNLLNSPISSSPSHPTSPPPTPLANSLSSTPFSVTLPHLCLHPTDLLLYQSLLFPPSLPFSCLQTRSKILLMIVR